MTTVVNYFKALGSTNSRKEKEAILEEIKSSNLSNYFLRICWLALDPRHEFNIVQFDPKLNESGPDLSLEVALNELEDKLLKEGIRGNKAIELVEDLYSRLPHDEARILKNVIDRTLRCGVSVKTINKVWPESIYEHPYMRCSSFNKKNIKNIHLPAISQLKEDGMYCDIVIRDNTVEYRARSGAFHDWNIEANDNQLLESSTNTVLQGEALVWDENHEYIMDRSTGNGYLNSDDVDPSRITFRLWDCINLSDWENGKSDVCYETRYNRLEDVVSKLDDEFFKVVDTRFVRTIDEIIDHFKDNTRQGLEGSVVKNLNGKWKSGTSKDQMKIKVEFECDLKIVDVYEGEKDRKYEGKLGGFVCETSDGELITHVGGGISDDEREKYWNNPELCIDKIVAVKANDVSKAEDADHYALSHSRVIELRNDKKEADNLDRVFEQKQAFIEALQLIEEE